MTKDEAVRRLNEALNLDTEVAHITADQILVDFLRSNGGESVADAYDSVSSSVGFWYA